MLVSLVTQPKPDEELRGLVWGLTREDPEDDSLKGDDALVPLAWLLGGVAIGLVVILNIVFI